MKELHVLIERLPMAKEDRIIGVFDSKEGVEKAIDSCLEYFNVPIDSKGFRQAYYRVETFLKNVAYYED